MTAATRDKIQGMITILDEAAVVLDRPEPKAAAAAYRTAISLIWQEGGITKDEAGELLSRMLGLPEV